MTIKPVTTTKRSGNGNNGDADGKKETHGVGAGQVVVVGEQSVGREAHRNVIDGHGQSPQRRGEVFEEISRTHRCSPHKSTRSKRRDHHDHHHHKRDRVERGDKHLLAPIVVPNNVVSNKSGSPHGSHASGSGNASGSAAAVGIGNKSPDQLGHNLASLTTAQIVQGQGTAKKPVNAVEEKCSGYNSGDEHLQPKEGSLTVEEWQSRDEQFAKCMQERGYELKPVEEDGACLFRSISLQIYGDEEMHDVIRQHTMDYIYKNREYFGQFVTEDINSYIKRKRRKDSHGNHIEIQAISEIYSRPVEVYCYESTPINIFNSEQSMKNGYPPLRLSYQRSTHYNAILDPYNATVGVGLGLAGYKPEVQTNEATRLSEQLEIEQTMFEDKLKTTDWEATNEAIEEQIARESYLQWCRDNLQRQRATATSASSTSATVTSAEAAVSDSEASPSKYSLMRSMGIEKAISSAAGTVGSVSPLNLTAAALNEAASLGSTLSPKNNKSSDLSFGGLSLKSLSHNLKKDVSLMNELGYESDATDMSSTSSVGHCGNKSPTSAAAASAKRAQKAKNRRSGNALRIGKKRRHGLGEANSGSADKSAEGNDAPLRKSPKQMDACLDKSSTGTKSDNSPEVEQLPCTSKKSITPNAPHHTQNSSTHDNNEAAYSSFYQELLEASYSQEGFNEAEMLNRAIQMSTQDYIEDQKRKYLYRP